VCIVTRGLLPGGWAVAIVALVSGVLLVDFVSLRRGALIFLGACLVLRALRAAREVLLWPLAVVCAIAIVSVLALGPRSLYREASYAVRSTVLRTSDSSTD